MAAAEVVELAVAWGPSLPATAPSWVRRSVFAALEVPCRSDAAPWQGFLLPVEKLLGTAPPHCLATLLRLPARPLAQLVAVVPAAKPLLAAFAATPEGQAAVAQQPTAQHPQWGGGGDLPPDVRQVLGI